MEIAAAVAAVAAAAAAVTTILHEEDLREIDMCFLLCCLLAKISR